MSGMSFSMVLAGSLEVILEFGSITFLLVSLLMAYANFKIRHLTDSSTLITIISLIGLLTGTVLIFYYQISAHVEQMLFIAIIYALLSFGSWLYSKKQVKLTKGQLTTQSRH